MERMKEYEQHWSPILSLVIFSTGTNVRLFWLSYRLGAAFVVLFDTDNVGYFSPHAFRVSYAKLNIHNGVIAPDTSAFGRKRGRSLITRWASGNIFFRQFFKST